MTLPLPPYTLISPCFQTAQVNLHGALTGSVDYLGLLWLARMINAVLLFNTSLD